MSTSRSLRKLPAPNSDSSRSSSLDRRQRRRSYSSSLSSDSHSLLPLISSNAIASAHGSRSAGDTAGRNVQSPADREKTKTSSQNLHKLLARYTQAYSHFHQGGIKGSLENKKAWKNEAALHKDRCHRCKDKGISCAWDNGTPSAIRCQHCATARNLPETCSFIASYSHWSAVRALKISDSDWSKIVETYSGSIDPVILRQERAKGKIPEKDSAPPPPPPPSSSAPSQSQVSKTVTRARAAAAAIYQMDQMPSAQQKDTESERTKLENTVRTLKQEVEEKTKEISDLKGKLDKRSDELSHAKRTAEEVQKASDQLRVKLDHKLDRKRSQLQKATEEKVKNEASVKNLRQEVEELRSENKSLSKTLPDYSLIIMQHYHQLLRQATGSFEASKITKAQYLMKVREALSELEKIGKGRLALVEVPDILEGTSSSQKSKKRRRVDNSEENAGQSSGSSTS